MSTTDSGVEDEHRFVDHVETKLLSPTKEAFTKEFLLTMDQSKQSLTLSGKMNGASLQEVSDKQSKLSDKNNSSIQQEITDNGLDEGHVVDRFVDRQESIIKAEEPEVIESPNKIVDSAFDFINAEAESLDAVNNNSEASTQCSDMGRMDTTDINSANYETRHDVNQYLGKEVLLHEKEPNDHDEVNAGNGHVAIDEELVADATADDATLNLYWYSTNLEIDPKELEAFKKSQNGTVVTSTMKMSFQDKYYKDKLGESDNLDAQDCNMLSAEKKSEEKDTWLPAFESVSSHCLDVASSLKSEPKTKKNIENASIKETGSNPPWGLEREDKVIEKSEAKDELPIIESEISVATSKPNEKSFELDDADAIGYIELKDKEEIERKKSKTDIGMDRRPVDSDVYFDESDAVGYMELKDRDEIKSQMGKSNDKTKTTVQKIKIDTVKDVNNQTKQLQLVNNTDLCLDESDAIGYMELRDKDEVLKNMDSRSDDGMNETHQRDQINEAEYVEMNSKPVEEIISCTDNKVAYTANVGSNVSIETTEKYAEGISEQIITSVAKSLDQDIESRQDDIDSAREVVDNIIERNVEKVTETIPKPVEIVLSHPVEVKRKFRLSSNTENKVIELGGTLIETELLVDEYMDDSSYSILLHDCWLRLRNKQFQMKLNSKLQENRNDYPETAAEYEIKETLEKIFSKNKKLKETKTDKPLDVLIDELEVTEFVTIETTKKMFQLKDFMIDLELTNLGPEVGDISVIIHRPSEMVPKLQQLDHIAKQIGMCPLQNA